MREPPSFPTRSIPVPSLIEASRQFERWRGIRRRGERIPPALWRAALALARSHGVSKTSQVLHLDYYAVHRRLAAASTDALSIAAPQQFVELDLRVDTNAPSTSRQQQCRLEIRDGDGGTLHIDLSGWSAPELASFVRTVAGRDR